MTAAHRAGLREGLLALLVLALLFLNFGHAGVAVAGPGPQATAASSFCGDPVMPKGGEHAPCHACRLGAGAALPPAPLEVIPVAFAEIGRVEAVPLPAPRVLPPRAPAQPRAPPLFA